MSNSKYKGGQNHPVYLDLPPSAVKSDSKYSNDEVVAMIAEAYKKGVQAAIAALPKFTDMKAANADQMEGWRDCAVLAEANLKALIGGDDV